MPNSLILKSLKIFELFHLHRKYRILIKFLNWSAILQARSMFSKRLSLNERLLPLSFPLTNSVENPFVYTEDFSPYAYNLGNTSLNNLFLIHSALAITK